MNGKTGPSGQPFVPSEPPPPPLLGSLPAPLVECDRAGGRDVQRLGAGDRDRRLESRSTSAGRPSRSAPSRNATRPERSSAPSGSPPCATSAIRAPGRRRPTVPSGTRQIEPALARSASARSGRRSRPTTRPRPRTRRRCGSACRRCPGRPASRGRASRAAPPRPGDPHGGRRRSRAAGAARRDVGEQLRLDVLARARGDRPARPSRLRPRPRPRRRRDRACRASCGRAACAPASGARCRARRSPQRPHSSQAPWKSKTASRRPCRPDSARARARKPIVVQRPELREDERLDPGGLPRAPRGGERDRPRRGTSSRPTGRRPAAPRPAGRRGAPAARRRSRRGSARAGRREAPRSRAARRSRRSGWSAQTNACSSRAPCSVVASTGLRSTPRRRTTSTSALEQLRRRAAVGRCRPARGCRFPTRPSSSGSGSGPRRRIRPADGPSSSRSSGRASATREERRQERPGALHLVRLHLLLGREPAQELGVRGRAVVDRRPSSPHRRARGSAARRAAAAESPGEIGRDAATRGSSAKRRQSAA